MRPPRSCGLCRVRRWRPRRNKLKIAVVVQLLWGMTEDWEPGRHRGTPVGRCKKDHRRKLLLRRKSSRPQFDPRLVPQKSSKKWRPTRTWSRRKPTSLPKTLT
ncbi:unnamed protein product [Amoebophrya sp. A120]|nr:unnamed protein product [Amoebophrya sp. A120]|eukprot:GSA120T00023726001.1